MKKNGKFMAAGLALIVFLFLFTVFNFFDDTNNNSRLALRIISPLPLNAEAVPKVISYQGRLTNDTGNLINGSYNMQFSLYDSLTGGNLIWGPETQNNVPVSDGIFNAYIGSVTSIAGIDFSKRYWLQLNVSGSDFSPRIQLSAVPYSFNSYYLDGKDSSYFLNNAAGKWSGTSGDSIFITSTKVGIGTASPSDSLTVSGNVSCDSLSVNGKVAAKIDGTNTANLKMGYSATGKGYYATFAP